MIHTDQESAGSEEENQQDQSYKEPTGELTGAEKKISTKDHNGQKLIDQKIINNYQ